MRSLLLLLIASALLSSCATSKRTTTPDRKWPAAALKQDLTVMKGLLEEFHPSLHAYLIENEWDSACNAFNAEIRDSLTTHQFLYGTVLPLLTRIRCGHTIATYPKPLSKHLRKHPPGSFPLMLKCWADTMMVVSHLDSRDSLVPRGSWVTSINGMPSRQVMDVMFRFMPTDGYAHNFNYHRLSRSFPTLHRNIFGLPKEYQVGIRTSDGWDTTLLLKPFKPTTDSSGIRMASPPRSSARKPLQYFRDSLTGAAVIRMETFDKRLGVRHFYRKSFRDIQRSGIRDLIVDIRNNGGGYVDQEVQLARYLKTNPFRVADTAAAVTRRLGASGKHFRLSIDSRLVMSCLTRREADGKYHLRYWERRVYHPHRRYVFQGRTHVLVSGPTFSAAALFAGLVKGQDNLFLLGEETGGGGYANNGLLLPECRLPNTQIRLILPLFRIVPNGKAPNTGRGVIPDILVDPDSESVRKGVDLKFETARKRILENPLPGKRALNGG